MAQILCLNFLLQSRLACVCLLLLVACLNLTFIHVGRADTVTRTVLVEHLPKMFAVRLRYKNGHRGGQQKVLFRIFGMYVHSALVYS